MFVNRNENINFPVNRQDLKDLDKERASACGYFVIPIQSNRLSVLQSQQIRLL